MTDDDDRVAALFGASSTAEGDAHQSPPFGIADDDTVTLGGIFAGRPSDTEEPAPGRTRTRTARQSPRSGRRRTASLPRVPQMTIGLPQVTAVLLLRIVSVVGILVIGWLFVHLVLSARQGGTAVKTSAPAATPAEPTVMPDARDKLLTARRVVQQAERRAIARRAAASRPAARQRPDNRRAAALRAARRRAARARAGRATPPRPPAPRSTTLRTSPTTRPRAPAPPPASGVTQGSCTPGDLGC
jgi:hypothetical protein